MKDDNPNKLKATLLSECSTKQQREFAKMLAEQCATADLQVKGHKCWFYVPSKTEWDRMKKYSEPPNYDGCPKCKKGRLRVQIEYWNMGCSWDLICSEKNCDFREEIGDEW